MSIDINFKTGKSLRVNNIADVDFRAFVNHMYENDVYLFPELAVTMSQVESITLVEDEEK